jgi:hypothetical protein
VGLPPNQRRTPEARDRRLGHDHRYGASPKRARPGSTPDWTDLDAVPQVAGVRPPLPRRPVRGGRRPRGARGGPGTGEAGPTQRGPRHRRRTYPCRPVRTERMVQPVGGRFPAGIRNAGSAARRNSGSRRPRDRRLNLFSERDAGNLRSVFRPPLFRRCRPGRAP